MKAKTEVVPISELKMNLFVRRELNHEHALYLAELIENGTELPPITINRDWTVIDGRHRIEAHNAALRKEIEAEIVDIKDESSLISEAYKANVGGSLPPTRQDIEHTVMLLLERGESKKRIGELLVLPPGMARTYINNVQSRMTRARIQRAMEAITEGGLTLPKAATQYDVDPDKLKQAVSGGRKKAPQNGVADMMRVFTYTYKSVSQKNAAALRKLIEKFEEGDVTEKQVRSLIEHLEKLQKQSSSSVTDWKKRFEVMAAGKKDGKA